MTKFDPFLREVLKMKESKEDRIKELIEKKNNPNHIALLNPYKTQIIVTEKELKVINDIIKLYKENPSK